jgi:hypothetical protein
MGDNEKIPVKEYINSQANPPSNIWQWILAFSPTKEGRAVWIGIFAFLFVLMLLAFIVVIKNPEMISIGK